MNRQVFLGLWLLSICSNIHAQPIDETRAETIEEISEVTLEIQQDWEKGELVFALRAPIAPYIAQRSTAPAYVANLQWRAALDTIIPSVLEYTRYNDTTTLLYQIEQHDIADETIEYLASSSTLTYSGLSEDFRSVEARYRLLFYPTITAPLPQPQHEVGRRYNWIATTDYSGIVIVAQGELPIHNTVNSTRAQPVLSPTVYDEELRVVAQIEMVTPEVRTERGMVAYDNEYRIEEWQQRVGNNPFILYTLGVRDEYGGDLIIANRDARRILINENNRDLIREGRILFILDAAFSRKTLTITIQ